MGQLVTKKYNKSFQFFKQHAASHVIDDIKEKGTTGNYSTRPGEGFLQEVEEAYNQTNKRNPDMQVRLFLDSLSSFFWTNSDMRSN